MAGTGLKTFMLIAGEPSGDLLASELVLALRERMPGAKFIGAGGPRMAEAGVELAVDMMKHAMVGIPTIGKYFALKRLSNDLLALTIERKVDAFIGVDYGGFNLRFGHLVKEHVRNSPAVNWSLKLVQFVSPQVWASRPGRAKQLAADYDLLLSIFPFEKDWYAKRAPKLRVEFVGHPIVDRMTGIEDGKQKAEGKMLLLLPGSRKSELYQHLPVMLAAFEYIKGQLPSVRAKMVLPDEHMKGLAAQADRAGVEIQVGGLPEALAQADLAINRHGDHGMRIFWRAGGGNLQEVAARAGHCPRHYHSEIADDAEFDCRRGSLSGIPCGRRHARERRNCGFAIVAG